MRLTARSPLGHWIRLIAISAFFPLAVSAQITDSQESADFLAQKIAESSGGAAEQYQDYSRGLAKTVSQLETPAQERVLEITPAVGGGSTEPSAGDTGDSGYEHGHGDSGGYSGGFFERFMAWLRSLGS